MKVPSSLALIFSFQFTNTWAGFIQMQYDVVQLAKNTTVLRSVSSQLGQLFDELNQYGCWCYFGDDHGKGHRKLNRNIVSCLSFFAVIESIQLFMVKL